MLEPPSKAAGRRFPGGLCQNWEPSRPAGAALGSSGAVLELSYSAYVLLQTARSHQADRHLVKISQR